MSERDKKWYDLPWEMTLPGGLVIGISMLVFYSWSAVTKDVTALAVFGSSFLVAGAAAVVGIFAGFLFGIPRSPQTDSAKTALPPNGIHQALGVNTNLEQISDWLTKIIVGIGLVELTKVRDYLRILGAYLQGVSSVAGTSPSGAALITICFYFSLLGFLFGYLWTRLNLASEFSRAEREAQERPEYYEGLIHALLYQVPMGFQNAIERGNEYLKQFGSDSARVWVYLACAYGQQYAFLSRAAKPDPTAMKEARDNALNAVQQALQLNPEELQLLQSLWDPEKATREENDLVVFAKDAEFQNLLGRV